MKYLINAVDTYRVETIDEVEALHEELLNDKHFELVAFAYQTKYNKKTEEEYQVVKAKKVFTDEKDPDRQLDVLYQSPNVKADEF